jgi:xanthine dehydrogenase iron-sulfur cluster and FAD-binding subunit A
MIIRGIQLQDVNNMIKAEDIFKTDEMAVAEESMQRHNVKFTVNGKTYSVQVGSNLPLRVDVLRKKLGLTSIKGYVRRTGGCGSCTVIMNEGPVLSCSHTGSGLQWRCYRDCRGAC